MSSDPNARMRINCPHCKHALRVAKSARGKRVVCLACREKFTVPAEETRREDADQWLKLEDDAAPNVVSTASQPASPNKTAPPKPGSSAFDDDLPELAPLPPPSPTPYETGVNSPLDRALAQLAQSDTAARDEHPTHANEEEFSFPCKVCGTLLFTSVSRIGSMTRCPDCHSEFSVPSRPVKKKAPKIPGDPGLAVARSADVRLAPIETTNASAQALESNKTKEILDRAAIEVDRERGEIDPLSAPFDSQRWLSLLFGCFRDPGIVFLGIFLGVCSAICFYVLHYIGSLEMSIVQLWILRAALFIVFAVPILISIAMCCMVIVPMAANRMMRVEDWPFGRFGEAMGEIAMLSTAVAIAAFPGGVLARLLSWGDAHPIVQEVLILTSIWGFTPIFLLSMIENNQILQPFSKIVFDSIRPRPDAWGAMYFQTGLILSGLFVLYAIAYITHPVMMALFGLVLPFGLFLIANQYGILAGRISDITHLGFEGDFSEDIA